MAADPKLLKWLQDAVARYAPDLVAVFRKGGERASWPLQADDADELTRKLAEAGHFVPLPKEPAALANVLEVSLVDFLLGEVAALPDAQAQRGTERGYPDLELSGGAFGGGHHAIDVKVARRNKSGSSTQSRITLYTGSSTTREYIGAMQRLDDLRAGNGEFATEEEFYKYWRGYRFKIGPTVQQQLDKLLGAARATS